MNKKLLASKRPESVYDLAHIREITSALMCEFNRIFKDQFGDMGAIDATTMFLEEGQEVPQLAYTEPRGKLAPPRAILIVRKVEDGYTFQVSLANMDYIHNPEPEFFPFANLAKDTTDPAALFFEASFKFDPTTSTLELSRAGVNQNYRGRGTLKHIIYQMGTVFNSYHPLDCFQAEAAHIATLISFTDKSTGEKYQEYFDSRDGINVKWKQCPLGKKGASQTEILDTPVPDSLLTICANPNDKAYFQLIIRRYAVTTFLKNLYKKPRQAHHGKRQDPHYARQRKKRRMGPKSIPAPPSSDSKRSPKEKSHKKTGQRTKYYPKKTVTAAIGTRGSAAAKHAMRLRYKLTESLA